LQQLLLEKAKLDRYSGLQLQQPWAMASSKKAPEKGSLVVLLQQNRATLPLKAAD
jgi:hypothetical protein